MSLESIPWAAIGGLTPPGLLTVVVVLILTGKLVPKSTYDVMVSQKEHWRTTCENQQQTIQTQAETIHTQKIASETIVKIMHAVQDARQVDDQNGGG